MPDDLRNRLGIAVGKLCYKAYRDLKETDRWQRLENLGARPQRLLFASTGTKDPNASDVLYVEALAAPNTIDTMPEETLLAFADHGTGPGTSCRATAETRPRWWRRSTRAGIDVAQLADDSAGGRRQGLRRLVAAAGRRGGGQIARPKKGA